jgi:hypothetical protein
MHDEHQVPLWFFIGGILLVYGVLIAGSGVFDWIQPPPEAERVALWDLHADLWWGLFMTAVGLFYCIRFNPITRKETLTGDAAEE